MKQCARCKIEKPTSDFPKAKNRKDGLYNYCRHCTSLKASESRQRNAETIKASKRREYQENKGHYQEYHRNYYLRNKPAAQEYRRQQYLRTKDQSNARSRMYYAKHRDKLMPRFRAYHHQNRDRLLAYHRAYYQDHKDQVNAKIKEARQQRIAANPDHENARRRQYYRRIRDTHLARTRSWRMRNKHKIRVYGITRRAREHAAEGNYTAAQWDALCRWFGNVCLACGSSDNLTVDHVVPLICGGSNYISNLQPLCAACNSSKNAKTIDYRDPVSLSQFLDSLEPKDA